MEFRQYLIENYVLNTVKSVMINVIEFYKFYDVEIYELPKINEKSIKKPQPIYFSAMPVTINTEVKKLHVKSPEFIKIENEKTELKLE